jgi:nicotinate-nucleotide pyrophosphorylase (carboxylating)
MKKEIEKVIKGALKEDLGRKGDITSNAIFENETGEYIVLSKDNGILCGKEVFEKVFHLIDENCHINFHFNDGDRIKNGDIVAEVKGKISSILNGERVGLNFICHLSGIATKTWHFVQKTEGRAKILDTRKTSPGLRMLQKYAVRCGGGHNHRMGLYDMVMIKDTHIDAAGSITKAVEKVKNKWGKKYKIEVEARNLSEVIEALMCDIDRIMLDNMDTETMKKSVDLINKKVEIEASGNMFFERLEEVSHTGVDYISAGELTHSVKAFDFSLKKKIR